MSVLVLSVAQRLGLGAIGFGLITSVTAAGGLLGTASYDWLERHASLANIMRVGLVIETLTHLGFALTTSAGVAIAIMFVFGAHAFIWGTTSRTVRMRAVPADSRAASGACTRSLSTAACSRASRSAASSARIWGVTGPFWFAFVGSTVLLVRIWRELGHIARDGDEAEVGGGRLRLASSSAT